MDVCHAIRDGKTLADVQALVTQDNLNGDVDGIEHVPMLEAVINNRPDVLRMLIDRGADRVLLCDDLLVEAYKRGHRTCLKLILTSFKVFLLPIKFAWEPSLHCHFPSYFRHHVRFMVWVLTRTKYGGLPVVVVCNILAHVKTTSIQDLMDWPSFF